MGGIAVIGSPDAGAASVGVRLARRLGRPHRAVDAAGLAREAVDFPGSVLSVDGAGDGALVDAPDGWLVVRLRPDARPVDLVVDDIERTWWTS